MSCFTTTFKPLLAPLKGSVCVPGDKSISHRAVLLAAMSQGTTRLSGVLDSQDVRATLEAVSCLGAQVNLEKMPDGSLMGGITGWGARGPKQPDHPIDCKNSGTTARLLMGVIAPWDISVTLDGDESLRERPMYRVIGPLSNMGASFAPLGAQTLPLTITGTRYLRPIKAALSVASAQVKTAILLAGLFAHGSTTVKEPALSRNHTELMLPCFGVSSMAAYCNACVSGPSQLQASELHVPGDPSSAAFLLCAAAICPDSAVQVTDVSLNPARIGFLRTLEYMGVNASRKSVGYAGKELYGILSVEYTPDLHGCEIPADKIATVIDEIPILSLVAAKAYGLTVFRGIHELRVKESDRLSGIIEGLTVLGVSAWVEGDDLYIEGDPSLEIPESVVLDAHNDHRLAMTWALVGLCGNVSVSVMNADCFAVSYPGFISDLEKLSAL